MSVKQPFHIGWKFTKQKVGSTLLNVSSPSVKWEAVDIPSRLAYLR